MNKYKERREIMSNRKSKYEEDFEPIDDTPDRVAKTLLETPPKQKDEWKYLFDTNDKNSD